MTLITGLEIKDSNATKNNSVNGKDLNDCLICKVMTIKHEKADLVKLIFSSKETTTEKARIASFLTGIEFDKEMVECLENPSINQFIFSD